MTDLIYSIPAALADSYQGQPVILRFTDFAETAVFTRAMATTADILYISLQGNTEQPLSPALLQSGIPLDYRLTADNNHAAILYRLAGKLQDSDLRISLPMRSGFSKTVQLATALNFAVKLEYLTPFPGLINELRQVIDIYLHQSTVSQPIDFLHSLLISFIHDYPGNLWQILEEDPAYYCFVSDQGKQLLPGRLTPGKLSFPAASFAARHQEIIRTADSECASCAYIDRCGCYFKWPDQTVSCRENKFQLVFSILEQAASEIVADQSSYGSSLSPQPGAAC
jgi:hypothetical protein